MTWSSRGAQRRNLWSTLLPLNMLESPVVRFTPSLNGGLAKVTVMWGNQVLGVMENIAGQEAMLTLSSIPFASLQGEELKFLIEPEAGYLGDGLYSLFMDVWTSNPHPFEVLEPAWKPFGTVGVFPPDTATLPQGETCATPRISSATARSTSPSPAQTPTRRAPSTSTASGA